MSCAVSGCTNSRRFKPEGISFHCFPRNELLNDWLNVLGKSSNTWIWSKNKCVCSLHFQPTDFLIVKGRRQLKFNAVPLISKSKVSNVVTSNTCNDIPEEILFVECNSSEEIALRPEEELEQLDSSSTSVENPGTGFVEVIHNYSASPKKLKMQINSLRRKQKQYRRKLYNSQQNIHNLTRRIANLVTLVNDLRNQELISDFVMEQMIATLREKES